MSAPARPVCNRPDKHAFRDRIAAALYASRGGAKPKPGQPHHGLDRALEPYRCPAGHWHLRTARGRGKRP